MQRQIRLPGIVKVLLAAVVFSFSGVLSKWMPWSAFSLVGARALIASILMALWRGSFKVPLNKGTVTGALGVCLTSVFFMLANKYTTAANAIVLQYAMPAFVIAFCVVFLHQKPSGRDIAAVGCALTGVVLCFMDNLGGGSMLGNFFALLSAVTYAVVFMSAKMAGVVAMDYVYLGNVLSSAFVVALFFDPAVASSGASVWCVAGAMGIILAAGYTLLGMSIGEVNPVTAAIISNVEPVLNPTWVFLALGEMPGAKAIWGAVVVLATVTVYSITAQRGQRRARSD
ncbi:MAG: DMT family transporter [Christensenellales bacterium]|jgi:drug/metabolite transporter (DMT)-like permease